MFGEAGFATADLALKQRIEKEIGLTALLYGDDGDEKIREKKDGQEVNEFVERAGDPKTA